MLSDGTTVCHPNIDFSVNPTLFPQLLYRASLTAVTVMKVLTSGSAAITPGLTILF